MKFAPAVLPALILVGWVGNEIRQSGNVEDLDEQIVRIEARSSASSSSRLITSSAPQPASADILKIETAHAAIGRILTEANQSNQKEDFLFQMQTTLRVLTAAEDLSSTEFIALIDRLIETYGSHKTTLLIMARIAAQEAPELILLHPSGEHWKNSHLRDVSFLKLLETRPDLCQKLMEEDEASFSLMSRQLLKEALLRKAFETDPATAFDLLSKDDFDQDLDLIPVGDSAIRANVAAAALGKFSDDPKQKLQILSRLIAGAFENGEPDELILHLDSFYPDDPTGEKRGRALFRSNLVDSLMYGNYPEGQIGKLLETARSISPEQEHQFIKWITSSWADSDLKGATRWLDGMPESPLRDSAVTTFAYSTFGANPAAGLEWAQTISDQTQAESVTSKILDQWRKSDPEAAKEWMQSQR